MNIVRRVLGAFGYVKRSAYVGATVSRLTADWIFSGFRSADQEIQHDFYRLRQRARERVRNDPLAARYAELVRINVVGEAGIQLQSKVATSSGEPDIDARRAIESAWMEWGKPGNCTVDGRLSWIDVQKLQAEGRSVDGEGLLRIHFGRGPFGIQLEVLDPDQIDTDRRQERVPAAAGRPGQNEIRYGVEVDRYGRPLAYYLFPGHPSEGQKGRNSAERVPAAQVIHLYKVRRPGQTRGVTDLAPGLLPSKMLDGLLEAEIVATRTAATKMGFFVREEGASLNDPNAAATNRSKMEAEPGLMDYLPHGAKDFKPWDPQHPTTAFEPFVKTIQRSIAAAWGVAYYSLTGDVSDVNYTSSRAAMLQERDKWRAEHTWWIDHLMDRVFLAWLPMATLAGKVRPPGRDWTRWAARGWMPRGWDWTDPVKDLVAAEYALRLGLDTRTRLAANRGQDFTEILETLSAEAKLAESLGLELTVTDTGVSLNLTPGKDPADGS